MSAHLPRPMLIIQDRVEQLPGIERPRQISLGLRQTVGEFHSARKRQEPHFVLLRALAVGCIGQHSVVGRVARTADPEEADLGRLSVPVQQDLLGRTVRGSPAENRVFAAVFKSLVVGVRPIRDRNVGIPARDPRAKFARQVVLQRGD